MSTSALRQVRSEENLLNLESDGHQACITDSPSEGDFRHFTVCMDPAGGVPSKLPLLSTALPAGSNTNTAIMPDEDYADCWSQEEDDDLSTQVRLTDLFVAGNVKLHFFSVPVTSTSSVTVTLYPNTSVTLLELRNEKKNNMDYLFLRNKVINCGVHKLLWFLTQNEEILERKNVFRLFPHSKFCTFCVG
jgi:hypothetical protein